MFSRIYLPPPERFQFGINISVLTIYSMSVLRRNVVSNTTTTTLSAIFFWLHKFSKQIFPLTHFCGRQPNTLVFPKWITTKLNSGMVIRSITHLATNTLPVIVFSLLSLSRYLLPITTLNRHQPTDSSGKLFFTTTSRNASIVRYRMSLVTILLLDFVMIHWIQKKSFRENSIKCKLGMWTATMISVTQNMNTLKKSREGGIDLPHLLYHEYSLAPFEIICENSLFNVHPKNLRLRLRFLPQIDIKNTVDM